MEAKPGIGYVLCCYKFTTFAQLWQWNWRFKRKKQTKQNNQKKNVKGKTLEKPLLLERIS